MKKGSPWENILVLRPEIGAAAVMVFGHSEMALRCQCTQILSLPLKLCSEILPPSTTQILCPRLFHCPPVVNNDHSLTESHLFSSVDIVKGSTYVHLHTLNHQK